MSLLADYHNETVRALCADEALGSYSPTQGERYDVASDLAIDLLVEAGLSPEDPDDSNEPISDHVQTLLTLAIFRSPELCAYVRRLTEG